jgi:hypothetical protein
MNRDLFAAKLSQCDAEKASHFARYWYERGERKLAIERQEIAAEWYERSRKWYQQGVTDDIDHS